MLCDGRIQVSYQASLATGSKLKVSLRMPDNLGFVENVKLLLNRYGEETGGEAELSMCYDKDNSMGEYSVFTGSMVLFEVGYRTFCFRISLNGQETIITSDPDGEQGILSKNGYYWELFVYNANFKTPDEPKGGIMYQIFVDTFATKDLAENEKSKTVPWDTPVAWKPDSEGEYHNNQFYGGNIQGIIDKIDYLRSLHVSVVYLTPIFQSSSTHRYDTDDYDEIDRMIGDWELLESLHDKLNQVGILLVLDLVLNHSGINNVLLKKYPELYYWDEAGQPKGWENFKTLPEFNKESPMYNPLLESVIAKCAPYCDGFRFDVADYMPDFVLMDINRLCIKYQIKYVIGEVWKYAFDNGRGFLNGSELHGVMNYRLGNAILWYTVAGNTEIFKYILRKVCKLYPKQALAVSPIFMSSHDTPRLVTNLVGEFMKKYEVTRENCGLLNFWDIDKNDYWWENGQFNTYKFREWEANHDFLPPDKLELSYELHKLAVFLQYTLPGIPAVFAGDDMGVWGYKDPFNRKPLPWNNIDTKRMEFYQSIGSFRSEYQEIFADVDNFKLVYGGDGHLAYKWKNILCLTNQTNEPWNVNIMFRKPVFKTAEIAEDGFLPPRSAIANFI